MMKNVKGVELKMICRECPRNCGAVREIHTGNGFCKEGLFPVVARAGVHMYEEPCISGSRGSGTVFFSGCSLKCVFCQNYEISAGGYGKEITPRRLREIYFELIEKGVHNINLVNPTHFSDAILKSLEGGLPVPVVYNTSGYDKVETLKKFDGKVLIYLPDLKYLNSEAAKRYSAAADYPEYAKAAIFEMVRQRGKPQFDDDGMMTSGVIIRHLILPGNVENTLDVIDFVADNFSDGEVMLSLMAQYVPCHRAGEYPEISGRLTPEEYKRAEEYLMFSGIEDGFLQELSSADTSYIPDFDLSGI